jgi:hypothetical protein
MRIEARLEERGIVLPQPVKPYPGVQVRFAWVRVRDNRAYVSPHMELNEDGTVADLYGKVGAEVSPERARKAARGPRWRCWPASSGNWATWTALRLG